MKYVVEGALDLSSRRRQSSNPQTYDLDKTIDVSFVGQCYGNRAAVIAELKTGIAIEAYGSGWPNGPDHGRNG